MNDEMLMRLVDGVAPATPGNVVGEITEVPYTAEYFFYRGGN